MIAGRATSIIAFVPRIRLRLTLAVIFTVVSLSLLVWGLWPHDRTVRRQFIQPTEMQLPAPGSFVPFTWLV